MTPPVAIATGAIVFLAILNIWQWFRNDDLIRTVATLRSLCLMYADDVKAGSCEARSEFLAAVEDLKDA